MKREGEMEGGALALHADGGNIALVILGYPLAHGQSDTGAAVLCLSMETLENVEDMIGILLIEPDTIVVDPDVDLLVIDAGGNGDQGWPVGTGIF